VNAEAQEGELPAPRPARHGKTSKHDSATSRSREGMGSKARLVPVRGDHNLLGTAEMGAADHGPVRAGHTRVHSDGGGGGGSGGAGGGIPVVAAVTKHRRNTPSPTSTAARRKGTPSPTQHGKSGSPSPRAVPPCASRSPSPHLASSPNPTSAGGGDTVGAWLSSSSAAAAGGGESGRRGKASPVGPTGAVGKHRSGGSSRRSSAARSGGSRRAQGVRQMSKSYDATTARDMKAIKGAFYADDMASAAPAPAVHCALPLAMPPVPFVPLPGALPSEAGGGGGGGGGGGVTELDDGTAGFDEELCSLHDESVHGDDCDLEVASAGGGSFASGSAVGSGAFLPVDRPLDRGPGEVEVFEGGGGGPEVALWVAQAANQKPMVPQGKQPLDGLLSESEHYPSKNPDEIHPDMIGNKIWDRMKALEKLVDLQRKLTLTRAQVQDHTWGPKPAMCRCPEAGDVPIQPGIQHWSTKDIEREIQQLGSDSTVVLAPKRPKTGRLAPDATMMEHGKRDVTPEVAPAGAVGEAARASPQTNGSSALIFGLCLPSRHITSHTCTCCQLFRNSDS
jgi:hypothetical protein